MQLFGKAWEVENFHFIRDGGMWVIRIGAGYLLGNQPFFAFQGLDLDAAGQWLVAIFSQLYERSRREKMTKRAFVGIWTELCWIPMMLF